MTLNGIDVSAAGQGANFPWGLYSHKIAFAFVKISEGLGYQDPYAKANIATARKLGIMVGGYHFVHADCSGVQQAEWFLRCASEAGLKPGDLLAVDCEDYGLRGQTAATMDLVAAGLANQLKRHHFGEAYNPVCYTEISMAPSLVHMGQSALWLANPDRVHTGVIGPWKGGPSFEQVSQRGVDCDVFYGDSSALAKLAFHG